MDYTHCRIQLKTHGLYALQNTVQQITVLDSTLVLEHKPVLINIKWSLDGGVAWIYFNHKILL